MITEYPLKTVLRKADLSTRISKWSLELGNFDIRYEPRTAIKGQALADFIAELTPELNESLKLVEEVTTECSVRAQTNRRALGTPAQAEKPNEERKGRIWKMFQGDVWSLHVDGASNSRGAGAGIVIVSPEGVMHENALTIGFTASNNEAEYEALVSGLKMAKHLGAETVQVYNDSQLIVNQIKDQYSLKDPRMEKYYDKVWELIREIGTVEIEWVGLERNAHADALASLATACAASPNRTILLGEVESPSIEHERQEVLHISLGPSWMDEIYAYLKHEKLPTDTKEAYRVRCKASYFYLDPSDQMYRRSFTGPDLKVVHDSQVENVLRELHEGSSGCHSGGRSLSHRALTQGYWWPKMKKTSEEYAKKCEQCQKHATHLLWPAEVLQPITSPWPFAQWGLDLVGKLLTAPGGYKHLITATDYYTKWVEAEPLITITATDVERFLWKNIISRFGVPYAIISDNGTQFVAEAIEKLCKKYNVRIFHSSVSYPQGNGQAEASNKTISAGIKRRLTLKRGKWAEELPKVLWGYRTTPRRSTGRTPFSMAYGMEAVLPLATLIPIARTENFDVPTNDEAVDRELDLAEELRDEAHLKHSSYQQEVARGYNKNVRMRPFNIDDLVLREVVQKSKKTKFKPN